ncbi:MAG TPA: flavodoxin domain-containing protein, partial [Chitinophagaceae bacterium]|nr:flavodoxin domain-containing protein [Chitinophagaceae bacterium]
MIPAAKLNILQELIKTSSKEEIIWINGYLNGLVSSSNGHSHVETKKAVKKISIVYGTETGNSKKLALDFASAAKKNAFAVKCTGLDQYRGEDISREEYLFIIISTHGEGEPPETARKFYDFLHTTQTKCPGLKYSVLALGDSSYPLFCKTGEDVDQQLQRLGATRIIPVQKCDVDYDQLASDWFHQVFERLNSEFPVPNSELNGVHPQSEIRNPESKKHTKKHYDGLITKSVNLNDKGSTRRTWHIEIRTEEDMDYEAGDSIAIVPSNRPEVVERIIALAKADGEQKVLLAKSEGTIRNLLSAKLNVCYLMGSTIKKYAVLTGQDIPDIRMDLVDLLKIYPLKDGIHFSEVLALLHPIAPRLYSVSSSAKVEPREVHITVSHNGFMKEDEQHYGLCSSFLGDLPVNSRISFYIHRNRSFKLPDSGKDIIMVGPGTGIAPFRSFLQERDYDGAQGRNWLFFGERNFTTDFFYQTEIQQYHATGTLNKVNLAFSRDSENKVYVQHRMAEHGKELFDWLDSGAHFYVSGSKHPMSQEVEDT